MGSCMELGITVVERPYKILLRLASIVIASHTYPVPPTPRPDEFIADILNESAPSKSFVTNG